MIFLGIRSKSGIAWKLVKGNDLSPTNWRLYRGGKGTQKGRVGAFWGGKLKRERERQRQRQRQRETERIQTWSKGVNKGGRGD